MRVRGYDYGRQRHWIPDAIGYDSKRKAVFIEVAAGGTLFVADAISQCGIRTGMT